MVQRWVVAASENQAITLRDHQQLEASRRVLERALARFGLASEPPELVQAVAKASRLLGKLG
jgi:hypothetical protein